MAYSFHFFGAEKVTLIIPQIGKNDDRRAGFAAIRHFSGGVCKRNGTVLQKMNKNMFSNMFYAIIEAIGKHAVFLTQRALSSS